MSWVNFRTFIEESMDNKEMTILSVYGYSEGMHSFNDEPDIPAEFPVDDDVEWNIYLLDAMKKNFSEAENLLMGRTAYIELSTNTSYHVWSISAQVQVIVDAQLEAVLGDMMIDKFEMGVNADPLNTREFGKAKETEGAVFKYVGMQDAIQKVSKLTGLNAPQGYNIPAPPQKAPKTARPKPGESAEKWWGNIIKSKTFGQPPRRWNPVTGRWQTGYDGD